MPEDMLVAFDFHIIILQDVDEGNAFAALDDDMFENAIADIQAGRARPSNTTSVPGFVGPGVGQSEMPVFGIERIYGRTVLVSRGSE
ncbi:hypothetical protein ColKHC_06433 [Colletotrichum higginsianum]|nr:hypothetical protein ColKHC_06433 [Colletotrichum higginsianum]